MDIRELDGLDSEELAALAAAGNADAVDVLLNRYKNAVKSKAQLYFMLGGDHDDVMQEGMIGLFHAIRTYDPSRGAAFRTYADLCINRRILTAIKGAARKKYSPLNTAYSLDKPVNDDPSDQTLGETLAAGFESDPEAAAVLKEMTELVMSSDSGLLSDFEHQVLQGLYNGRGYRQIAEDLGKPAKSVDNAIQRIRKKLMAFFSE